MSYSSLVSRFIADRRAVTVPLLSAARQYTYQQIGRSAQNNRTDNRTWGYPPFGSARSTDR